jgi:PAS domain S-box-containing protein
MRLTRWVPSRVREPARRRIDVEASVVAGHWTWQWLLGAGLAVIACLLTLVLPVDSRAWVTTYTLASVLALVTLLVLAMLMPPSSRTVWWALWVYLLLTVMAESLRHYDYYHSGIVRNPGVADLMLLASYVPAIVAVSLMIRHLRPGRDREAWIDAAIMTIAIASVVGVFVVAPTLTDAAAPQSGAFLALSYPLLDLIVLSVLLLVLVSGGRLNPSVTLLAISASLFLIVSLVNEFRAVNDAVDTTSAWLETLHLAAILTMTAAAGAPGALSLGSQARPTQARTTPTRMIGLGLGVLTAPTLLALAAIQGGGAMARLLTLASIIVIVLALWRIRLLLSTIQHQRSITARILESAGDGIVGLDTDGIVLFANLASRRLLRCRESDLVGKRFHDVAHYEHEDGSSYPWSDCPARELIASGREGYLPEQAYLRRDGTIFPVEVIVAPVVVDGRLTGAVTSFRDVSERHAVDEIKRQFIAIVSHELRTPLTSIKGSLQLLDAGVMGPVTESQQELLTMAVSNSDRLARLVDDILDMERLDAGRMPLHPEPVDARDIAGRAVMGMAGAAGAAGVGVALLDAEDAGTADCTVAVDPHRMLQVLTNLLGNAVKFSENGATVEVDVRRDDARVLIGVRDHGRGIPADDVAKVFERFRQVEAGDARRQGGTGLGLAIAREIVVRSGGTIEVQSTLGVGSTFTVALPATRPPEARVVVDSADRATEPETLEVAR